MSFLTLMHGKGRLPAAPIDSLVVAVAVVGEFRAPHREATALLLLLLSICRHIRLVFRVENGIRSDTITMLLRPHSALSSTYDTLFGGLVAEQ